MLRMTAGSTHEAFHLPHWEVILYVRIIPNNTNFLLQSFLFLFPLGMKNGVGLKCLATETAGCVALCRNKAGQLRLGPNGRFLQVFNSLTDKNIPSSYLPWVFCCLFFFCLCGFVCFVLF